MVPEEPTLTNNPVEVVVVLSVPFEPSSLLLLQEMKVELKRNMEKMMSICLTRFPIGGFRRTHYIPELGLNYNVKGVLLGGCLTL
jgi:hypothetical protein